MKNKEHVSVKTMLKYLNMNKFDSTSKITENTLYNYFNSEDCKYMIVKAKAEDVKRMEIEGQTIFDNHKEYCSIVKNYHPMTIYNMDEIGINERGMDKKKNIIISKNNVNNNGEYRYRRNNNKRRMTVMVGISVVGDITKLFIIVPTKRIENVFYEKIPACDIEIVSNDTAFCNCLVFREWVDLFIRHIISMKGMFPELKDKRFLLSLDNFTAHKDDESRKKLSENNVDVFDYSPHASHLQQQCDLVAFSVLKNYFEEQIMESKIKHEICLDDIPDTHQNVYKEIQSSTLCDIESIYNAYLKLKWNKSAIISSFHRSGIYFSGTSIMDMKVHISMENTRLIKEFSLFDWKSLESKQPKSTVKTKKIKVLETKIVDRDQELALLEKKIQKLKNSIENSKKLKNVRKKSGKNKDKSYDEIIKALNS